jgi:GAF domain
MGDNESSPKRTPKRPIFRKPETESRYGPLAEERQVLEQIVLGAPLPQTLNRLCTMIDNTIVNVVAMVSLPDDEDPNIYVSAETAAQVGLKLFSSIAILSRDHILLGTLEIYGCDPRLPTPHEIQFIERVVRLAAFALQRYKQAHERSFRRSGGAIDESASEKEPFIN